AAAKNIETKPIFQWSALAGAEGYELMVARDAAFGDLVINRTGSQTLPSTAWQSDTSLDYATTYYWKVRGITVATNSAWSDVGAFSTRSAPAPTTLSQLIAPSLHSPANGASLAPVKLVFQWDAVAGVSGYELLVAPKTTFADPVIIRVGEYALTTTAWQSDTSLDYATTYYWKVRGVSADTQGEWSDIGSFITEPVPTAPSLPPAWSSSPQIYYPRTGSQGIMIRPAFQWSAVDGGESYELIVATDASFTNQVINRLNEPATAWQPETNLDYNTTYYWRVRAAGTPAWSDTGVFITEPAPAQPAIPVWAKYLFGILILNSILISVTLVLLTIRLRRI
ncbi:MAG: fibronectin type III domain-containing protein, partial [Dehalococcoidales bacterium]|nr:fibronectin type III domain-containing protein [Dehalococcoidales bacterium]